MSYKMGEIVPGLIGVKLPLFWEFPTKQHTFHALMWNNFENLLEGVLLVENFDSFVIRNLYIFVLDIAEVVLCEALKLVQRMLTNKDQAHDIAGMILLEISFKSF